MSVDLTRLEFFTTQKPSVAEVMGWSPNDRAKYVIMLLILHPTVLDGNWHFTMPSLDAIETVLPGVTRFEVEQIRSELLAGWLVQNGGVFYITSTPDELHNVLLAGCRLGIRAYHNWPPVDEPQPPQA